MPYAYSWVIKHFKAGVYNENSNTSLNMLILTGTTVRGFKHLSFFLEEDILASAWSEACNFCSSNQFNLQWHVRNPGCCLTLPLVPVCSKIMCLMSKSFYNCNIEMTAIFRTCNFSSVCDTVHIFPVSSLLLMSWNKSKCVAIVLVLCVLSATTTPAFVKIPPMINLASRHSCVLLIFLQTLVGFWLSHRQQ